MEVAVLTEPDLNDVAKGFEPDVIAFGATTGFHRHYLAVVSRLKQLTGAPVVMGGAHATFFPEVLEREPGIDYLIIGEAEESFRELLKVLAGRSSIEAVGNLRYRSEEGAIVSNELLPLVSDLDSIPFPDRRLVERYGKRANRLTAFVITGRDCPYNCTYCFNHTYRQIYSGISPPTVRKRSVDNVITEIEELLATNSELQMVIFQDDIFTIDPGWVFEFCDEYGRRVGIPFHCPLRANHVTREMSRAVASSGRLRASFTRLQSGYFESCPKCCQPVM